MRLDLNECFPPSPIDGTQGPLPKQKLFMDLAMDRAGPKYIRYCGGIGSGKTRVGCTTVLMWAVLYPGDYLVCRQFLPELKITTLATFKEVCPPELIVEERVADGIIRIKGLGGKTSNVIFRGLEEPDKHRSLNLSGFYIDESSQVSEEAFMLLQGRLRGTGIRKGILTTNSAGHDWQYRWFVKQDMIRSEEVKKQFVNIYAPSTENHHLPPDYFTTMLASWSEERIQREIYANEDTFEGMVYNEFRQDTHVIRPFAIPNDWPRYIGIDHGFRNPAAWVWGAMSPDGDLYIYREFYQSEWLIEEICGGKQEKGRERLPGVLDLMRGEKIEWSRIDPSTKAKRNERNGLKISDFEIYQENLPADFPLFTANNEVQAGIDKVKSYLKIHPTLHKPKLFIFNHCVNLIEEIANYRYMELTVGQQGRVNEKEDPRKYKDHAVDALRYLIMGLPEAAEESEDIWKRLKYNSLEGALYRDLQNLKDPKPPSDPFGG